MTQDATPAQGTTYASAGVDVEAMQRYNAAYRRHRMVPGKPYALLMPAASVDRFRATAELIPAPLWNDWREERAARAPVTLDCALLSAVVLRDIRTRTCVCTLVPDLLLFVV